MINNTPHFVIEQFKVKPLPYSYNALEPLISEQTLHLHHDKHYAGYINNLNRLVEDTRYAHMPLEEVVLLTESESIFNNAAQAWNHEFFFDQLSPTPKKEPTGALLDAFEDAFGTFDEFIERATDAATSLFGSGWVWLVIDYDKRLSIIKEQNANNPITRNQQPILTIDVWEHAYYTDYQNNRKKAIQNLWKIINWFTIEQRYLTYFSV